MSRLSKLSLALFLLCAVSAAACPLLPEQLQTAAGAMFVAFLACGGCLLSLEKSGASPRRLALIAAFTALSVCSRVVFAVTPGFKPVSALVILCGLHFGAGAGMATGALTALLSNLYFGQGPWTPFQMAGWGLIGLLAGLLAPLLQKNKWWVSLFGAVAGVLFSLVVDVWSALFAGDGFSLARYGTAVLSSLPFTGLYAASNAVFLFFLHEPFARKLTRIRQKYGL